MKLDDLATRVLEKITVLAAGETASAADLKKAREKLAAVHAALDAENLLRWTKNDLPVWAQEPYVMMAGTLAAPEFGLAATADMWNLGLRMIQSGVSTSSSQDPIPSDSY